MNEVLLIDYFNVVFIYKIKWYFNVNIINNISIYIYQAKIQKVIENNEIKVVYCLLQKEEEITESFFRKNTQLKKLAIPPSIVKIGDYSFDECSNLIEIAIPSSVTSIGYCAFRGCSSLIQISVPSTVVSIHNYAFKQFKSLKTITIPSSVTFIGDYSFDGCISN